jgi:hypothetical protein
MQIVSCSSVFLSWTTMLVPMGALHRLACQERAAPPTCNASPTIAAALDRAKAGERLALPRTIGTPDPQPHGGTVRRPVMSTPKSPTPSEGSGFTVEMLSRGKGVPAEARDAFARVRELVEKDQGRGVAVTFETTRIGLEGETRLCVDYKDTKQAGRTFKRAKALVRGIDLINLVPRRCAPRTPPADRQE